MIVAADAAIDGRTVQETGEYLRAAWPAIRKALLDGTCRPAPVRRVSIPKPGGGERELGIPTVVDRLIQQALLQVLQPLIDPSFSAHSYGFRPGRSAHGAVLEAQQYVQAGHRVVVDAGASLVGFDAFPRARHVLSGQRLPQQVTDPAVRLGTPRRFGFIAHGSRLGFTAPFRRAPRSALRLLGLLMHGLAKRHVS